MFSERLAEVDANTKTLTGRPAKDHTEKPAKDHNAKEYTKTLTEKLAKDHAEGDASIGTLTGMLAKDLAEVDAETLTGGSFSYPLVDPRPEEVLDVDNSASFRAQSPGGSTRRETSSRGAGAACQT